MKWKSLEFPGDDTVKIPKNWIYPHFYEGLNILFRIENTLRVFVYAVLKNHLHEKWLETNLPNESDDGSKGNLSTVAQKRINQYKNFGYLGYSVDNPIMYLTSGELINIIMSKHDWPIFQNYFPAKKDVVKIKLDEIGTIRNSLAHFRPLRFEDIGVLQQNSVQILSGVNNYVNSMLNCNQLVPTNTPDNWHTCLKCIGSDDIRVSLKQNLDKNWLKIEFIYKSTPIYSNILSDTYICSTCTKLVTSAILNQYPIITNAITFCSEVGPFLIKEIPKDAYKTVQFTIGMEIVQRDYEIIAENLIKMFNQIRNEDQLLQADNLARGELIEAATIAGNKNGEEWNYNPSQLQCINIEGTALEYWGDFFMYGDFITSIIKFPWMPVQISGFEF